MRLFLNRELIPLAQRPDALIVHPHCQRTGGGTLRNTLAAAFGAERVYSRMFVPNYKSWSKLTDEDLRGYRAYTDLSDYRDLRISRPCLPVALVREPLYRAVSLYHFIRGKKAHELYGLAMSSSLEEFYRIGSKRNPRYFRNV